jgi:hypothetical protein
LVGSTTLLDTRKRKRSLCNVGLIAISTNKIQITLAEVKIKAHLSNSDIVCFSTRRKINQVGKMNKKQNKNPNPIKHQNVVGVLILPWLSSGLISP